MNRLFVVGDSFSADNLDKKDPYKAWYAQTAEKLGLECDNHSLIGASQDWCWWKIAQNIKSLTPEDQIVVVITHPGRFWFFDNHPGLTNYQILNIDEALNPEQIEAVKKFIMLIQRPPLDIQQQSHRLGWLDAQIRLHKLRPAQVICAFPIFIQEAFKFEEHINWLNYENVKISKGDLLTIESRELKKEIDENTLWQGYDCRYNHLLKENHTILAELLAEAITEQKSVDLTCFEKFKSNMIDYSVVNDEEFCKKHFDLYAWKERADYLAKNTDKEVPWAKRSGLVDFLKGSRRK